MDRLMELQEKLWVFVFSAQWLNQAVKGQQERRERERTGTGLAFVGRYKKLNRRKLHFSLEALLRATELISART